MNTRSGRSFWRGLWTSLALLTAVHGCSLQVTRNEHCTTNRDCRSAFGLGSVCAPSGFCAAPQRHPRCTRTYPEDLFMNFAQYRDYFVVGTIYSYRDHLDSLRANELAIRQVNENGGLRGRKFAVVHCDYTPMAGEPADMLTDVQATEAITHYLTDTLNVPLILGPRGSSRAVAAFNAMKMSAQADATRSAVIISPSATSPSLTPLDNSRPTDETPGLFWRTVPPDTLQGEVIARDLNARMIRRVAVPYQTGAYGEALAQLVMARFQGADRVVQLFPFTSGMLGDVISMVGQGNFEEVLLISSNITDYVAFLNGATATPSLVMQYQTKNFFFPDAAYNQMLIDNTMPAARAFFARLRGTRPAATTGPIFDQFAADYQAAFNSSASSSGFTAHSYDAAWIGIYGFAWAFFQEGGMTSGTITAEGIARGLRKISSGRATEIRPRNWPAVQDAFSMRTSIDVVGASGALNYDPATEETSAPIEVWKVMMDGATYRLVQDRIENM